MNPPESQFARSRGVAGPGEVSNFVLRGTRRPASGDVYKRQVQTFDTTVEELGGESDALLTTYEGEDPATPTVTETEGETTPTTTNVAKIGDTEYATLDEAIEAAEDGATITLLANCETAGLNLDKNLTIAGSTEKTFTVTFKDNGIALWGRCV